MEGDQGILGAGGLKVPPKRMKRPGAKAKVPPKVRHVPPKTAADRFSSEDEAEEPPAMGGIACKQCGEMGGGMLTCGGCQGY